MERPGPRLGEGAGCEVVLRWWTRVMDATGAMLFGRRTYELMEDAWPQVARDPKAPRSSREWAHAAGGGAGQSA